MHIVIGIITALGAVSFWIYRMRAASEAAREIADVADNLVKLPRRLAFRRKTGRGGLELVEDPREAAAVLLVEMSQAANMTTSATRHAMLDSIEAEFFFSSDDAEALVGQATWLLREAPVMHVVVSRMTKLVHRDAGPVALAALDGMLACVAEADGAVSEDQADMLDEFRRIVATLARDR